MFAEEEEWADGLPAKGQPRAGVKTETPRGKSKAISKRCLMRTLQTLGSVPKWHNIRASDGSDGEMEDAPAHISKKKKKSKKLKESSDAGTEGEQHGDVDASETPVKKRRTKKKRGFSTISDAGTEGEQHGEVDASETPVKKRRTKQKPKKRGSSASHESLGDGHAKGQQNGKEDSAEKALSRKQWRNRIKNKKRCKNKFRDPSGIVQVNLKKAENVRQPQATSNADKKQVDDLSSGRMESEKKSDFIVPVNTHTHENDKATKIKKKKRKDKASNGLNHLQPIVDESVSEQPKKVNNVFQKTTDAHKQSEKQKPVKVDKNAQVSGSNTKLTEEKQETSKSTTLDRSSALRQRMEKRLESARFRYINELLYTSTSGEAKRMFKQDPDAIAVYHKGYTEQVKHWPVNPVDSIIFYIQQKPASLVVADFGCGDCKIARSVKNEVHCFDLAPVCDLVTACDMANVPLANSTVDIAVFCLSLMGTNLGDFLAEANRVLVDGGVLKIAEVASRFDDTRTFTGALARLGFKLVSKDTENTHFYSFEFVKVQKAPNKKIGLQLKPCLYKKR